VQERTPTSSPKYGMSTKGYGTATQETKGKTPKGGIMGG
jgi:hypothetical protein